MISMIWTARKVNEVANDFSIKLNDCVRSSMQNMLSATTGVSSQKPIKCFTKRDSFVT